MPEAKLSNPGLESLLRKGLAAIAADEPAVSGAREAYRRAACVLAAFNPMRLRPCGAPPDEGGALLHLVDDCTVLHGRRGGRALWALKPEVRRETLKALWAEGGVEVALAADAEGAGERSILQSVFETCLRRKPLPPPERMGRDELQAALVVAHWLEGISPDLPPADKVRKRLDRLQLLAQFEHLIKDGFAGRKTELDDLRNHVGVRKAETVGGSMRRLALDFFSPKSRAPLALWGPGGVGKSTLVAKFVLEHAAINEEAQFPYAYIDFDNGAVGVERSAPILNELLRQLQLQYPHHAGCISHFRNRTRNFLRGEEHGVRRVPPSKSRPRRVPQSWGDTQRRLDEFFVRGVARLVRQIMRRDYGDAEGHPFLLVFDTFENVQHASEARVKQLWRYIDLLRKHLPNARVVVAGRDELKTKGLPGPTPKVVHLGDLDRAAAYAVLEKQGVGDTSKYAAIYRQTGGNPLSLRLAAAAYRQGSLDTSFTASLKAQVVRQLPAGESLVQGHLYERILGNIPDEKVRRLANPGLALRLISAPAIMEVLREPCGISVGSLAEAAELLRELEKASLVEREGDALRHRADVRRVMLGPLDQAHPGLVRQINEKAVEFYSKQEGPTARAEEIYHRLRLGQGEDVIKPRWEPGVEETLRAAMDELPIQSQVFLASRLNVSLSDEQLERLTPHQWEQVAASRARDLLAHGMVEDARALLAERPERSPNSPLYVIEAEVAVADNRLDLAQAKLDQAQRAAIDANDTPALLLAIERAAEVAVKADDPVLADRLAARAAELAVALDDPLARLRALLLQLQLQPRLTRADQSAAVRRGVAEAFEQVLERGLWESARALVRAAAVVLAGEFPDLFFQAFRIAGFGQLSAQAAASMFEALSAWANESGHAEQLHNLAGSRNVQQLELVGEIDEGGGAVHLPPAVSHGNVSALVEELLSETPHDPQLQKAIAVGLDELSEPES